MYKYITGNSLALLTEELERLQIEGLSVKFWWRDDDATAADKLLLKAINISINLGIPLSLAVVPGLLQPSLPLLIANKKGITVIQHGLYHTNHEDPHHKKSEFGQDQNLNKGLQDILNGYNMMKDAFGEEFLPVFVPPWNRIDNKFLPFLKYTHLKALSSFETGSTLLNLGFNHVNVSCDFVNWDERTGYSLEQMTTAVLTQLQSFSQRTVKPVTHIGILTHHQLHTDIFWSDFSRLVNLLKTSPNISWVGLEDIYTMIRS